MRAGGEVHKTTISYHKVNITRYRPFKISRRIFPFYGKLNGLVLFKLPEGMEIPCEEHY